MYDLKNNGQSEMLSGLCNYKNLIPFASVSAEDKIETCNPASADLSGLYLLLLDKDDQHRCSAA